MEDKKGLLKRLENKFGLPPFKESVDLLSGDKGKTLDSIVKKLEKLLADSEGIKETAELLRLVKELDEKGTLERLNTLLTNLKPLTKGSTARMLVEKLDKMEKLISTLVKE